MQVSLSFINSPSRDSSFHQVKVSYAKVLPSQLPPYRSGRFIAPLHILAHRHFAHQHPRPTAQPAPPPSRGLYVSNLVHQLSAVMVSLVMKALDFLNVSIPFP